MKKPYSERDPPSRQSSAAPLRDIMERYPSRQLTIPPMQVRCKADTTCQSLEVHWPYSVVPLSL